MINSWQEIELIKTSMIASDVKSLIFKLSKAINFQPGQYMTIKTISVSGYPAERDYSIASTPKQVESIEFGIQILKDGEVSPKLFDLNPKDKVFVNGPKGNFFEQKKSNTKPLILVAGGSGVIPFRSMILSHLNNNVTKQICLFISCKNSSKVPYLEELEQLQKEHKNLKISYTFTQESSKEYKSYTRRIDSQMIKELYLIYRDKKPDIFICGPTPFVETASIAFITNGFDQTKIKTERFG